MKTKNINKQLIHWIPVIIFIAIAIGFRLYRNSADNYYLLAGSDGPYLPVQVKSLFKHFRLAFPDMPLLFVLCTILAKVLFFVKLGTENECILMSIRLIDSFLPPLAAIPVFLITKELCTENIKSKFSNYFLVAFSILSFTPLFLFSFQLQKNGLATVFIFTYLYYAIKLIKYQQRIDAVKASIVLFICVISHIGSFGLLVFISLTTLIIWLLIQKNKLSGHFLKIALGIAALLIITFSLIAVFDFSRFNRIINVPLKIFEAPVLLFALNGQNFVLHGPTLFILITLNLLTVIGLVFLIVKRKQIETYKLILGMALGACSLFLSNPFLGLEWASRLYMMAYIPTTVLYIIIFNTTTSIWIKIPTVSVFAVLLILSFGTSAFDKSYMTIDNASFIELQTMKDKNLFLKNDAIVARQSLRILSNWVFETKGVDKYLLTKDEFNKYSSVYLLKQIKGKNTKLRGAEPSLGDSVLSVYKSEHFEVYKVTNNSQLPINEEKIFKGIRGTVQSIEKDIILVNDIKTNKIRNIHFDCNNTTFPKLSNGMKLEINGEWLPFSIDIKAETIKEISGFEEN